MTALALSAGEVRVWWARRCAARADLADLLDPVERSRKARLRRSEDQQRFLLGASLLRRVAGAYLGVHPAMVQVDRRCAGCGEPHGKPAVPGSDLELSLSHSGDVVVLAAARHTPLGIDVEEVAAARKPDELAAHVLAARERAALDALAPADRAAGFVTYWCRKESVVKATGDGLRAALPDVQVSPPGEPARLLSWSGRAGAPEEMSLRDLAAPAGYRACLAVLGPPPGRLVQDDAGTLLAADW
ncbi:MAG TPA: 4'-phosphopantetheinyl transferase superfamily protein [Pilimelia sp.]|nr:4'-phosphopantetheinyl transferase superfamily protein [Pilimelia sp.]